MKPADILKCANLARVFPLKPGTKNGQLLRSWKRESSQDPATIQEWAKRWPDANWAFALGRMPDGKFLVALDIDKRPDKNGFASLARLEAEHGKLPDGPAVRTPSGGEHRYFTTDCEVANSAGRLGPGLDIRAAGGYTLCPGSVIDGHAYQVVGFGDNIPPMPQWLAGLAGKPRTAPKPSGEATIAPSASTRAERHLKSLPVSVEGSRNDDAFRAAATIKDFGLSEADCVATMIEHWQVHPPLPLDELQRTVASAYNRAGLGSNAPEDDFECVLNATTEKRTRFPSVKLSEITPASGAEYLIKGVLDRGALAVVYGAPGSGKTFLSIDLAGHIAAGRTWRDKRTKRGLVVYVAAEAGESILRRFYAWRERNGADADLIVITRGANLLRDADVRAFMDKLQAVVTNAGQPLALVVFDTLSRSIAGADENSASDISKLVGVADLIRHQFGAATLAVHHSGKDSTKGARGSSALPAAADTVIQVSDKIATLEKSRDGRDGEQLPFDLEVVELWADEDGDAVTTCLVKHRGDIPPERRPQPKLSTAEVIAMRALRIVAQKHGKAAAGRDGIPAHARTVTIDQWRDQFQHDYGTDSHTPSSASRAFRRARLRLAEVGLVGVAGRAAWATADDAQQPTETPASPEEIFS